MATLPSQTSWWLGPWVCGFNRPPCLRIFTHNKRKVHWKPSPTSFDAQRLKLRLRFSGRVIFKWRLSSSAWSGEGRFRPRRSDFGSSIGSRGRARTYNITVNSRALYH
jgi:hypothetical protein